MYARILYLSLFSVNVEHCLGFRIRVLTPYAWYSGLGEVSSLSEEHTCPVRLLGALLGALPVGHLSACWF